MEQETQLFVNIRLSGSGGSMWVTMKLAATWKYHLNPRGNFHSRTGEPVHSLNEILNVLEF